MLDIDALEGFEWDEHNLEKNWHRHNVAAIECEQVLLNRPLLVADDVKHSLAERRHFVLGRTNAGSSLFIVFTVRAERIRVISARDMSKIERQKYAEATP